MILALNTSQPLHEIALIDEAKILPHTNENECGRSALSSAEAKATERSILLEKTWQDQKDTLDRLIPLLEGMLSELAIEKSQITDIAVVKGPGPFTAVRTGVAFVNALAEGLQARLHEIDTLTLLRLKAASKDQVISVVNAGGNDVGVLTHHEVKVGQLATLLAPHPHDKSTKLVSECTETQEDELNGICLEKGWTHLEGHKLLTLAEVILTYGLDQFGLTENVEPYYLKKPVITKSKNPWKKP
ncbi:tRNA (adenosine(37)-N6)-threonylcarbamoyltransferase complex dimerization subunit type 1 TsaB [Patescibacteria group bacterium]|nr:tRNA (adenosine(37)-N6)-threonylcarbamoyltransferase complex dimerization subunit type 1 TsaB [Patescibacteria group bacterium]